MNIRHGECFAAPGGQTLIHAWVDGNRTEIAELLRKANEKPGGYELKVERRKRRRSLDANGYAWVLIDKLADALGADKTEVYKNIIRDIGGVSEIVCVQDKAVQSLMNGWAHNGIGWQAETLPSKIPGCTNVILYYGSSVYDSRQMSALIDRLVDECRGQGIETLPPEEIRRMKEAMRDAEGIQFHNLRQAAGDE